MLACAPLLSDRIKHILKMISCGFDACEHEYSSMSRHGRKVPTSFYHRFARDARVFANEHANGKIISVLEGGYSDRALISGAMAHVAGLADTKGLVDENWWSVENLTSVSPPIRTSCLLQRGQLASPNPARKTY